MPSTLHELTWAMVKRIPRGRIATYGQIAALVGMPRHARHVGQALAATPATLKIPWHRVVNADGRVSVRLAHWEGGGDRLQRILLEDEGVLFDGNGRVDLRRYRWQPAKPKL